MSNKLKISLKNEYRDGYPLVNLRAEHFDIADHYRMSGVVYERPIKSQNTGKATITLINEYGDLIEQDVPLEFAFTETDRLIKAAESESFKIRRSALTLDNPRKISTIDILPLFDDVEVVSVTPHKTEEEDVWNLEIISKMSGQKRNFTVQLRMDYKDLSSVSEDGLPVERNIAQINKVNPQEFTTFDDVPELNINPDFIKGSPPVYVSPDVIIQEAGVDITYLEYLPPSDIDSKEAAFRVKFESAKNIRKQAKLIGFKYAKTIREASDETISTIYSTDFKYLVKDRSIIPTQMDISDFEYKGGIKGVDIVDVKFNYDKIEMDRRFVPVSIIVEFKTINYKIDKVIEFVYSKSDYVDGSFREVFQESESVTFPTELMTAKEIKKIMDSNQSTLSQLVQAAKISPSYPYNKVTDVKISRFFPDSNVVIFAITAMELRDKLKVTHNFEKTVQLKETLNEMLLDDLNPENIIVKQDALPSSPSADLDWNLFIAPNFTKVVSIQYAKPEMDTNLMPIQIKLASGSKTRIIEKTIEFDMSENEFNQRRVDEWEQNYLNTIDPSTISINIDTSNGPVEQITKKDINGVPEGIDVSVRYNKPTNTNNTRVFVTLTKGNSRVTFEQSIFFKGNN